LNGIRPNHLGIRVIDSFIWKLLNPVEVVPDR